MDRKEFELRHKQANSLIKRSDQRQAIILHHLRLQLPVKNFNYLKRVNWLLKMFNTYCTVVQDYVLCSDGTKLCQEMPFMPLNRDL